MGDWPGSVTVEAGTVVVLKVSGLVGTGALAVTENGLTTYPNGTVLTFRVNADREVTISKISEPAKTLVLTLSDGLTATYYVGGKDMGGWPGSVRVETGMTVILTVSGLSAGEKLRVTEGDEIYVTTDTDLVFHMYADRTVSVDRVPVPVSYTVTVKLDADGGTVSPTVLLVDYGKTAKSVSLPMPVYEGKDFHGWYDGDALVGPDYVFKRDVTLTAHWTDMVDPEPTPTPTPDEDIDKGSDNTMLIAAAAVAAIAVLLGLSVVIFRYR
jgi:hypothetical protein